MCVGLKISLQKYKSNYNLEIEELRDYFDRMFICAALIREEICRCSRMQVVFWVGNSQNTEVNIPFQKRETTI